MEPLRGYAAAGTRHPPKALLRLKKSAVSSIETAFEPTGQSQGLPWRLSIAQFRAISKAYRGLTAI